MNAVKQLAIIKSIILVSWMLVSCSNEQSIFFDIPEGQARQTLGEFAAQSSIEIIYNVDEIGLTTTNQIYGKYNGDEALRKMLKGTSLMYARDEKSGAIAVWNRKPK